MSDHKHSMTGLWALDALDDAERAEVEQYLAENPEAAEEARTLRETAAHLGAAAGPATPPARAKADIMSAIKQTRQLPPLPHQEAAAPDTNSAESTSGNQDDDGADSRSSVRGSDPAGGTAPADAAAEAVGGEADLGTNVVPLAAYRRKQRSQRLLAAAAAVLLVATGVLTGVVMVQQNELDSTQEQLADSARYRQVVDGILASADATTATVPSESGGAVHLTYSASEGAMLLKSSGLPELPADRAYELWLISADGAEPAGLLTPEQAAGSEPKILQRSMEGVTHFGITVEPATGSEQPTTDPIVLSEL
ncbi:anti-sigma factor [Zhihengliuella sp.]|uniref:anti-sigma factor n=1 Tax=Zhihengliuella sp. TaxID=1954483 RepID=UPI0028120293|nr:anti-sigma factor [Zhihengliuella sp.]